MPSIRTLIPDINQLLKERQDGWFTDDLAGSLGRELSSVLKTNLGERTERKTLRLSQMGEKCPRHLWYSVHHPELAEALRPEVIIKFTYGHMIESLILMLARAAGHDVQGEQDEILLDGIKGHRDAVIDGCIVDVKSAASRSFQKFQNGTLAQSDTFGYLDQLDGYVVGCADDPLVTTKDRGYLLAVDKQLGHLALYEHFAREHSIRERARAYKAIVSLSEPPACTCETVSDGGSGNIKLGLRASYSPFKYCCFPNLRTFLYSDGPRYLTRVVRTPMNKDGPIPEVDRHGKRIYH